MQPKTSKKAGLIIAYYLSFWTVKHEPKSGLEILECY